MDSAASPYTEIIIRGGRGKIYEYSLLLASQKISHEIGMQDSEFTLKVLPEKTDECRALLELYHAENRGWYPFVSAELPLRLSPYPLVILVVPVLVFLTQTGVRFNGSRIAHRGVNDSAFVLQGEWWRTITSLTLHLDLQHFASNMVTGFFLINLLVNRMSWAFALLWLTLLSGGANYLNAVLSHPHRSLGFSTAVFACLGMLVSIQLLKNFLAKRFSLKAWTPLLGGAFLVALMGLNENTDINAHVLGFAFGLAGGFIPGGVRWVFESKPGKLAAVLLTAFIYGASWFLALR